MKKTLPFVSCYMYKDQVYLQIPKGYKYVDVIKIDGKVYGKLKKQSFVPDLLILLWLSALLFCLYQIPSTKHEINIPTEFYVSGKYLNVDINNPTTNNDIAYIKLYSENKVLLYETELNPGESIGAIEIDTNHKTYILEYTIRLWDFWEVSHTYRLSNASFQ